MPSDRFIEFRSRGRLDRVVRTTVVATVAALAGVVTGGVAVFAVFVNALQTPDSQRVDGAPARELAAAPADLPQMATSQPKTVSPAPAIAPVEAQSAPAPQPPQPNSWPDALTRATHREAESRPSSAPPPPAAAKQTNTTAGRAADIRQTAPSPTIRTSRPLYGYAPQPPQPERNVRTVERTYSNQGSIDRYQRPDRNADEAGGANPRRYESRVVRPPQRPGNADDSDAQMQSLIGDDEFVGDWHH